MRARLSLMLLACLLASLVGQGQQSILWEISSPTTPFKSYLFGSYHLLGNSFVDSLPVVLNALDQADVAIFESLEDGSAHRDSIQLRSESDSLQQQLGDAWYTRLINVAPKWRSFLRKLNRTELLFKLMQEVTYQSCKTVKPTDTWDNLDNYLIHLARKRQLKTVGLETDAEQLSFLENYFADTDTASFRETIQYLTEALESTSEQPERCALVDQYRKLEIDFELQETGDTSMLVKGRNTAWMQILPNLLRQQRCFIAVGLIHLMYNHGLIQQLRKAGFILRPIKLQP